MTHKTWDHTPVESPDHISAESRDHVLATYRQIADRFRLGGSNAARTKVKRAGWTSEPPNHPADPLRIRVPREVWEQATERPHHKSRHSREKGRMANREILHLSVRIPWISMDSRWR